MLFVEVCVVDCGGVDGICKWIGVGTAISSFIVVYGDGERSVVTIICMMVGAMMIIRLQRCWLKGALVSVLADASAIKMALAVEVALQMMMAQER